MYRQAEGFVLRSPSIRDHFKCQEGYRRIKCLTTTGRIQVYAADDRTADGVIPTLAILDELHRHRDLRLYRTWRGKLEKRGGQILTISTAGEPGSDFEETRAAIMAGADHRTEDGAHVRAESAGVVLHDWAVRDRKKVDDIAAVKAANPRSSITVERLTAKRASPTMSPDHWARFVCNIATRAGGVAIKAEDWDALRVDDLTVPPGTWTIGWVDLGWEIDTTAVGILAWESRDRVLIPAPRVITPPVAERDVADAILDFQEAYSPVAWVYDPNAGGRQMAQMLEGGDHPSQVERPDVVVAEWIEHGQGNVAMGRASGRMDEWIRNRRIAHDGDRTLRTHVLNAVKKALPGETFRYDRPKDAQGERRKRYPIDALTGITMGLSVAVTLHEEDAGDEILVAAA
jgi:phage terminase large subunit-like protein